MDTVYKKALGGNQQKISSSNCGYTFQPVALLDWSSVFAGGKQVRKCVSSQWIIQGPTDEREQAL